MLQHLNEHFPLLFPGAKKIIVRMYPLGVSEEERNVVIRSQVQYERLCKIYGSIPTLKNVEILRFKDLTDGGRYVVSDKTLASISTIENAILRQNHEFATKVRIYM